MSCRKTKTKTKTKILGQGTYGLVTIDPTDDKVAIKTIPADSLETTLRELTLLKFINHPNIIKPTKLIMDDYLASIKLGLVRYDTSLENYRTKLGSNISPENIAKMLRQIGSAVTYLHSENIIHCDLTPSNILVNHNSDGTDISVALCDFGLSKKLVNPDYNLHDCRVCVSTYRAPEIYLGAELMKYTPNIDTWSFGCVIYFILTGQHLMDFWEYTAKLFPRKRQESSLYVSKLLNLPDSNNHLTRLKRLKAYSLDSFRALLSDKLSSAKVSAELISQYLDLLSDCLTLNYKTRPTMCALTNKYTALLTDEIDKSTPNISATTQLHTQIIINVTDTKEFAKSFGKLKEVTGVPAKLFEVNRLLEYTGLRKYADRLHAEVSKCKQPLECYNYNLDQTKKSANNLPEPAYAKLVVNRKSQVYWLMCAYLVQIFAGLDFLEMEELVVQSIDSTTLVTAMIDIMKCIDWNIYKFF